jgi:hypothetical protein
MKRVIALVAVILLSFVAAAIAQPQNTQQENAILGTRDTLNSVICYARGHGPYLSCVYVPNAQVTPQKSPTPQSRT